MPSKPATYRNQARRPSDRRPCAAVRGYDREWQRIREAVLSDVTGETYPEGGPLCRDCMDKGLVVEATEVDHITAHRGDPILFRDPKNLRSRCKPCHSAKTVREDGGFGRTPTVS